MIPDTPEVVSQIAQLYESAGDIAQALEWYQLLISIVPTDPDALARIAELFDKDNDKSQAYQHMLEVQYHAYDVADDAVLPLFPRQS